MSEHLFPINPAAVRVIRQHAGVDRAPMVRVYRCSPERVCLQVRGEKMYATVDLPFDVAVAIADALHREVIDDAEGAR